MYVDPDFGADGASIGGGGGGGAAAASIAGGGLDVAGALIAVDVTSLRPSWPTGTAMGCVSVGR